MDFRDCLVQISATFPQQCDLAELQLRDNKTKVKREFSSKMMWCNFGRSSLNLVKVHKHFLHRTKTGFTHMTSTAYRIRIDGCIRVLYQDGHKKNFELWTCYLNQQLYWWSLMLGHRYTKVSALRQTGWTGCASPWRFWSCSEVLLSGVWWQSAFSVCSWTTWEKPQIRTAKQLCYYQITKSSVKMLRWYCYCTGLYFSERLFTPVQFKVLDV